MMYADRATEESAGGRVEARVAVYPDGGGPEVNEVSAASSGAAAAKLTKLVSGKVREMGGKVPEEAVSEVVENLVHAGYRGVVISVLDGGNVVRVSDKGPGIPNKDRAFEFGFSGPRPRRCVVSGGSAPGSAWPGRRSRRRAV